ncbi:MAG: hydrogenase maturation nickel metallochaperone HypA [Bryobacteraceae bacterium]
MGIASSVLDAVRVETARHPGSKPLRVGVRVGEWAGVDTESLRFCFDALVTGSDLAGLQMDLDYRVRRHRCKGCAAEFEVREYAVRCPACASEETEMIGGAELDIAYLELEDD